VTFVGINGSRPNNCMEENWAKLKVYWATLDFLARDEHFCNAQKEFRCHLSVVVVGQCKKRHALYVPSYFFYLRGLG